MKKTLLILVLITSLTACGLIFFWNINMSLGQVGDVLASIVEQANQESRELLLGGFSSIVTALIAGSIAIHRMLNAHKTQIPEMDD